MVLRMLNNRMELHEKEKNLLRYLIKGYKGELLFDEWLTLFSGAGLILNDLLLEHNNTIFQIDTLLFTSSTVYLFEVKNYEGDYLIEGDRWYTKARHEIKNPLLQLRKNDSLLSQLLHKSGCNLPVITNLIFVNPGFHLYNAPFTLPAVFSSQKERFISDLSVFSDSLSPYQKQLAERLSCMHLKKSPYFRLPEYKYEKLKKGICCAECGSIHTSFGNRIYLLCDSCSFRESYEKGILRSIGELKTLFPDKKLTTNLIQEWCQVFSKVAVRSVLGRNFTKCGNKRGAYYVVK
ncbi:nuclease-related domain-containing protein [Alteribacter natronophilus]|uniref:nuclease-related domain-containing protein n=1 Tax=Alteribacter natronophilus TaxID=2583810 RepID=UPI0014876111|nr:nuclease-related domain-containing protein [Alteribacter natronophilus]